MKFYLTINQKSGITGKLSNTVKIRTLDYQLNEQKGIQHENISTHIPYRCNHRALYLRYDSKILFRNRLSGMDEHIFHHMVRLHLKNITRNKERKPIR